MNKYSLVFGLFVLINIMVYLAMKEFHSMKVFWLYAILFFISIPEE